MYYNSMNETIYRRTLAHNDFFDVMLVGITNPNPNLPNNTQLFQKRTVVQLRVRIRDQRRGTHRSGNPKLRRCSGRHLFFEQVTKTPILRRQETSLHKILCGIARLANRQPRQQFRTYG